MSFIPILSYISTHHYFLGNNCQEECAKAFPVSQMMRQRYLIFLNAAAWERNMYATHSKE